MARVRPEGGDLGQGGGDGLGEGVDYGLQLGPTLDPVGVAVAADDALVDRPGDLDLGVLVGGEQRVEAGVLTLGEEAGGCVQEPPGPVERIISATAVAVQVLLDAAPAMVEGVAGEADDVEGVMPTSA